MRTPSSRFVPHLGVAAVLAAATLAAWVVAERARAQTYQPAPVFEGKTIPEPPEQGKPWTRPETRLPKFLATATDALFSQGVADPRGCEYRKVEIANNIIVEIHAFVLPERPDVAGRFVVGWDGQVYPAVSIGEPADLDHDIQDLVETLKTYELRSGSNLTFQGIGAFGLGGDPQAWAGAGGVKSHSAIKLCMLLRLGRADLAEALFAAGTIWTPEPRARDLTDYGITYRTLAINWAIEVYGRLIQAHQRADDVIALDAARKLAKFRDLAAARMDEMGFPPTPPFGAANPAAVGALSRFPFLQQLDALLADQEQRAVAPPRTPIPPKGSDPALRTAALIRDLDQIAETQMSSPGSASPGSSRLVKALIEEGDPAVEPLLKALESDERLTRSVTYGRSFTMVGSSVHPVVEPVFSALIGILRTSEFSDQRPGSWKQSSLAERKALADSMRRYWERNRDIPLVERWYKLLLDDQTKPELWGEAAGGIAGPEAPPGVYVKPGTAPSRGEPLRDGRSPSVTDLMLRRAREIAQRSASSSDSSPSVTDLMLRRAREIAQRSASSSDSLHGLGRACGIASSLVIWDERASLPLLQELSRQCRTALDYWRSQQSTSNPDRSLASSLADFTMIRTRLGDAEAIDEYADWLRTTSPKMLESNTDSAFKPLIAAPDHPALVEAARWMFTDPESPWTPILPEARGERVHGFRDLVASALLVVPAFREAVISGLADETPIGTASRAPDGGIQWKMNDGSSGSSSSIYMDEEEGDAPGGEQTIRCRDLLASRIAKIPGAPRLELSWPEERRNRAVAASIDFLTRYGPRFEARDDPRAMDAGVRVAFPTLGRPATQEDVAATRAIFALEGDVRTVDLPSFPQEARWLTLKDSPQLIQRGNGASEIHYQTDGLVWQAEEVREGNQWVRYYGFVGQDTIGKAPADEIEFGSRFSRGPRLTGGLTAILELGSPSLTYHPGLGPPRFEPGQPITLTLHIDNPSGLDQTSPTEFLRPAPDGKPALRKGIILELVKLKLSDRRGNRSQPPPEETEPAKHQVEFEPTDASRILAAADRFEALQIDLNDWFDLPAPGFYSVSVTFTPESGLGEAVFRSFNFQVGGE